MGYLAPCEIFENMLGYFHIEIVTEIATEMLGGLGACTPRTFGND